MFVKECELVVKKSTFISYLMQDASVDKIKEALSQLKKQHKKATHICWAARIDNPFFEKAVDDGEPNSTAGKPILSVMQKKDVKNACVFVVRYFGGIKLGGGGLVRAYTKAASILF